MNYKLLLLLLVFAKGFSQNAILDNTFGVNGKVTTSFGQFGGLIIDTDIQSDGKIVAFGYSYHVVDNYSHQIFALVRYNADGSIDTTFGNTGKILVSDFWESRPSSIKIQNDGKIIVTGSRLLNISSGEDILLIRYNSDGTLDSSFGQNGYVVTDFGTGRDETSDVILQTDNKILISLINNPYAKIVRYNTDGTLDTTFGVNGVGTYNLGPTTTTDYSHSGVESINLQSDGKIIMAGGTDFNSILNEQSDTFVMRIDTNGDLDTTFGINGFVTENFNSSYDYFHSLSIANDDSIIATGFTGFNLRVINNTNIILAKYTSNGIIDSSFGTNGKVITQTNSPNLVDLCWDSKIQNDGKIVCFGSNGRGFNFSGGTSQPSDMLLLRYNQDGSLDTSFSPTGYLTTSFDNNVYNNGEAVVLQNDGKIIVGGSSNTLFALARYTFDNLSNTSFTNKKSLSLVPNPANDFVNFDKEIVLVKVYTNDGKNIDLDFINNSIDVSRLSKGIYLVIGKNSNGELFENKLIKN